MITVEQATEAWLGTKKPNTRRSYARGLAAWREFCERKKVDPLEPTLVDLDVYKGELLGALAASSAAQRMAALGSWHDYLRLNGLIDSQATKLVEAVKFDRHHTTTRSLSAAEVAKMLAEADRRAELSVAWTENKHFLAVRDAAIVRMLVTLGLREGDLTALDTGSLGQDGGERVLDVVGKGGARTRRFVPEALAAALDRYNELMDEGDGPLFVSIEDKRLDPSSINDVVERVARAAGLDDVTPHMLRHTMAAIATEAGAELVDLQVAMGHSDPKTTERYQQAVRRLRRDPARLVDQELLTLAA